jgi:hypothetical protein
MVKFNPCDQVGMIINRIAKNVLKITMTINMTYISWTEVGAPKYDDKQS